MKHSIITTILSLFLIGSLSAQDKLLFMDGSEQAVVITEISNTNVKYTRADYTDGPVFTAEKSGLFMILFANGSKEVIDHKKPTAASDLVVENSAQPVQISQERIVQEPTSAPDLPEEPGRSVVQQAKVDELPDHRGSEATVPTQRHGRTFEENMALAKRRRIKGGVMMGVGGGIMMFVGMPLIVHSANKNVYIPDDVRGRYSIAGAIATAAGFPVFIIGAAVLGSSRKYKRFARELADIGIQLTPEVIQQTQYAGVNIESSASYGLSLRYTF